MSRLLKISFLITAIVLLAAACNNQAAVQPDQNSTVVQKQPTETPAPAPTPTPSPVSTDQTANWKTYTNSRVGYQFEYPASGLQLGLEETIKYPSTQANDSKTEDLVQFGTMTVSYSITTEVGVKSSSIESWIQDTQASHTDPNLNNYTKLQVGGQTAYMLNAGLVTYVYNSGNVYIIDAHQGTAPSTDKNDTIYNHLLSTFKFTDSAPQPQSGQGILTGHVTVGPMCGGPVGGTACPSKPEAFTSRTVFVYKADGKTLVTSMALVPGTASGSDQVGTYRFDLPAGIYVIKANGSLPFANQTVEGTVNINVGQTTTLDFSISTGML